MHPCRARQAIAMEEAEMWDDVNDIEEVHEFELLGADLNNLPTNYSTT
jgi:hypothetical protein